jgi:hypothetical protein
MQTGKALARKTHFRGHKETLADTGAELLTILRESAGQRKPKNT